MCGCLYHIRLFISVHPHLNTDYIKSLIIVFGLCVHACVYIFPVVALKCSVIFGCRLSEDTQLSMTSSNLMLFTMLKLPVN